MAQISRNAKPDMGKKSNSLKHLVLFYKHNKTVDFAVPGTRKSPKWKSNSRRIYEVCVPLYGCELYMHACFHKCFKLCRNKCLFLSPPWITERTFRGHDRLRWRQEAYEKILRWYSYIAVKIFWQSNVLTSSVFPKHWKALPKALWPYKESSAASINLICKAEQTSKRQSII